MEKEVRLIDANALIDAIEDIDWYHVNAKGKLVDGANPADNTPIYKAFDIYNAIKNAPTVDAVEVKHGEWLDGAGVDHNGNTVYISIDCSVCEEVFKIETHDREYWKARFKVCPFCGAKVDGDGNG